MKTWPEFNDSGDLPPGIHQSTLTDVIEYFGKGSFKRSIMAARLQRICTLAKETAHVSRFIIFGSFVTTKQDPQDIDIFLLMDDKFDVAQVTGESRIQLITSLLKITKAQVYFGLGRLRRSMVKMRL